MVVRGEGRAFCAGIDLGMPEDRVTGRSPAEKARNYYEGIRWAHERFKVFAELPQPIVAAVQGYCLGFGFELVLMCDIRICAEDAKFALPEAQVGVGIDAGGDLRLAHEVGAGWAKMLALTGRRIDARTAERIGIVQEVTTTEELLPTAMTVAHEIAANAPLAVQSIKRSVDGFAYRGLTEAMRFEAMSVVDRVRLRRHAGRLRRQGQEAAHRVRREVAPCLFPTRPPSGTAMLPPGTFDVDRRGRHRRGHGSGQGHRRQSSPVSGRLSGSCRVVPSTVPPGWPQWRRREGAPPRRPPTSANFDQVVAAFDVIEAELGPPSVLVNNAAANFPVPAEDLSPGVGGP